MKTEAEAREMWCPYARVEYGSAAVNRGAVIDRDELACIASKCMQWRWARGRRTRGKGGDEEWQERGYCGRAGRPE